MCISDWCSDVFSSDLRVSQHTGCPEGARAMERSSPAALGRPVEPGCDQGGTPGDHTTLARSSRSDERRVGNECVCTCRSRWSAGNQKKDSTTYDQTTPDSDTPALYSSNINKPV